jgi:hypothetical protein
MPYQPPGEAELDALPRSYTCAHGRDWDWRERAACREPSRKGGPFAKAWVTDPWTKHTLRDGTVILGSTLIEVALSYCFACPAQYHCATWAIEVGEVAGTWSMSFEDLEFVRRRRSPIGFVRRAEFEGIPVQVAVRDARAHPATTLKPCDSPARASSGRAPARRRTATVVAGSPAVAS